MTTHGVTPLRWQRTSLLALVVLAAIAACGGSDDKAASTTTGGQATTTQAPVTSVPATSVPATGGAGTTSLRADLTGAAEVPGPGDAAANGGAVIRLDPAKSEVCWELTAVGLDPPGDKAHIHRGVAGQAGSVVVTLTPPDASGPSTGCAPADGALITELNDSPQGFYVNLHNTIYPNGAVRGQLTRAG